MVRTRKSNFSGVRPQQAADAATDGEPTPISATIPANQSNASIKVAEGQPVASSIGKKSNFDRPHAELNIVGFKRRAELVRTRDETGREQLLLVLPSDADGEVEADLSYLLAFPGLVDPFADALLRLAEEPKRKGRGARKASSVLSYTNGLKERGGFFAYLAQMGLCDMVLSDLSTQQVNNFIEWLNRRRGVTDITRQNAYFRLYLIVDWLQKSSRWKRETHPRLQLPPSPWPEAGRQSAGRTEIIPQQELGDIYRACYKETVESMGKVRKMRQAMETAKAAEHPAIRTLVKRIGRAGKVVGQSRNPYHDIGVLLATLRHHDIHLPLATNEGLRRFCKPLADALNLFGGRSGVQECFGPSYRTLVPFVLLMGIHLYYNLATLTGSKVDDYSIVPGVLGRAEFIAAAESFAEEGDSEEDAPVLKADPAKLRAQGQRQLQVRPVTDDPDNPGAIWMFVKEWTQWIRPLASPMERDVLFLALSGLKGGHTPAVRPFWVSGTQIHGGATWGRALKAFYEDHGLPYHSFKRYRATGLDMVELLYGGDIRAKAAAGVHAKEDTTYQSYTTPGQAARGDEALAWVRLRHERWRETRGRVDPRHTPKGADLGAATPGWKCADPFSGPFNPVPGKLCSGYGFCPNCPHGGIDSNDPYACAQAFNLLDAIDKASGEMAPQAWAVRWQPVRDKLIGGWLPLFSEAIVAEAKTMNVSPLPALE